MGLQGQRKMGRRGGHEKGLCVQGWKKGSARISPGNTYLTSQLLLLSICNYEGSSFKYYLTEDFRMDCKICPAYLKCTSQSL